MQHDFDVIVVNLFIFNPEQKVKYFNSFSELSRILLFAYNYKTLVILVKWKKTKRKSPFDMMTKNIVVHLAWHKWTCGFGSPSKWNHLQTRSGAVCAEPLRGKSFPVLQHIIYKNIYTWSWFDWNYWSQLKPKHNVQGVSKSSSLVLVECHISMQHFLN